MPVWTTSRGIMPPQEDQQPERRLAAIFAADVEGYSRLMRAEEVGTLRTLTAHREVMDRLIEERRLRFRIGVHVGDVMVRGGDLFGDGVNIAARLQTIAEPAGCASPEKRT